MAQTPDPDGLMQQLYPLLGGKANVVKESRQSSWGTSGRPALRSGESSRAARGGRTCSRVGE